MRIAVVSDIHGNRTAFDAVLADLRPEASDAELQPVYGSLSRPIAVHGHIHRSYVRNLAGMIVANSGSVSFPMEYDLNRELKALSGCGFPYANWIAKTLASGRPQMP
jgi:predicted phosphodiesterase